MCVNRTLLVIYDLSGFLNWPLYGVVYEAGKSLSTNNCNIVFEIVISSHYD